MRFIDSKNWMFLKSGLDDFRNGMPVPATDDIFIKVQLLICSFVIVHRVSENATLFFLEQVSQKRTDLNIFGPKNTEEL